MIRISTPLSYLNLKLNTLSEREFYIGGSTFAHYAYSILCLLGLGALIGSKKLKRITVLIQKEPISLNFFDPEGHLVSYSIV